MSAGALTLQAIVEGSEAVLAHLKELLPQLILWSVADEAIDLPYLFALPQERQSTRVTPHLLLFARNGTPAGAVLLYRHEGLLRHFDIYTTRDRRGLRSIFAPAALRTELAALAARELLARGATFVNLDFTLEPSDAHLLTLTRAIAALHLRGISHAVQRRTRALYLPVASTPAETLAHLGRRTRKNYGNYRRLLAREQGCAYIPQATPSLEAFLALNQASTYTVSARLARWRYDSLTRFPNTFLAGFQDSAGNWLSVIACRRHGSTVHLDWQMNRADLTRYSLSLVLRGALIEHESSQGTTRLYFEGGSPSHLKQSFTEGQVYNLAARSPGLRLSVLEFLFRRLAHRPAIQNLYRPGRQWQDPH